MKRVILLVLLCTIGAAIKTNAQNLKKDAEFFKATTHILVAFDSFDAVNKGDKTKNEALPLIEKNLNSVENSYNKLKSNFGSDADFKTFELWVQGTKKLLDLMKENDQSYVLGVYLTRLDINDFINLKL